MNLHTSRAASVSIATCLALSATLVASAPAALADPDVTSPGSTSTATSPFLEPYYTAGDLTGDKQVTAADLAILTAAIGTTSGSAGWSAVAAADLDGDGVIDLKDVAALAQKEIYDDGSFDLIEASAVQMQKAMNAGVITSVQLTEEYLKRIEDYAATVVDTSPSGRALNAIISTGGQAALDAAAESDTLRAENGGPRSMLDGIPILLKDNYDTKDMPTSAGCACWETNQTADDAFMVDGMRAQGAVILGKASLDEFAYGFSSTYSAGSPITDPTTTPPTNGTKLVASPYNTAKTAGGSSGGTGAAIAANLGGIGFGTDTGGSIRNPSSYNQLVGVRPTVGLTSRDGIVPLALSQDTGGPIGRTVEDAAIALDAVVGTDPNDAATAESSSKAPASYTQYLDPHALDGKSFAYFTTMVPPASATNAAQVAGRRIFMDAVTDLEAQGATVTAIDPSTLAADPTTGVTVSAILGEGSGSTNEFKHDLNAYIAAHLDPAVTLRTLDDIIASGMYVPGYRSTYVSRNNVTQETYDAWMGTSDAPGTHTSLIANGGAYLTDLMDTQGIDAIVYPTALPYTTYSSNLRLSPNTGMPAVTVPAGQTTADETLPGAGVNLEFLGRDYDEGDLLGYAYAYEQRTKHRTTPALFGAISGDVVAGPGTDDDAPGDGSVTVTGSGSSAAVGGTYTVEVKQSADDLYAYRLELGYDPNKLRFVSATSGTTGTTTTSTDAGTLTVTHTKAGTSPGAQGETTLATVTFTVLKPGTSTVTVNKVSSVSSAGTGADVAAPGATTVTVAPGVLTPGTPTITGTAKVDSTLIANPGTWPAGTALSYQWTRNGAAIAGATKAAYTLVAADAKKKIAVTVTGTKTGYATAATTSAAVTVTRGTLKAAKPTITGKAKAGRILKVKPKHGRWTPGTKLTYTWRANGKKIAGAHGKKLKITKKLAKKLKGKKITAVVTGKKPGYVKVVKKSKATKKVRG